MNISGVEIHLSDGKKNIFHKRCVVKFFRKHDINPRWKNKVVELDHIKVRN